ncbi:MAG: CPBP family intramembrane metalloprotease [Spirochaetales bacterium]|nr:CPBP family intramembrane metalloprotease [Spirochaetales bacterium]
MTSNRGGGGPWKGGHPSFRAKPWLFFGITLAVTWTAGFAGAALQDTLGRRAVLLLIYGGALAPAAVAVVLGYAVHDRVYRADYWRRVIDIRRIRPLWHLAVWLLLPAKAGLAALIDLLLGGGGIRPEAFADLAARPQLILPTLAFWLLFGPLPEELGWRGYALNGLQGRCGALGASLLLGVVWVMWHLPLFFVEGTWQAAHLGFGTLLFWFWAFGLVMESVLYTWIHNNTGFSILSAVLFHFVGNSFGELFELSRRAELLNYGLAAGLAALVVLIWGSRTLTRGPRDGRGPSSSWAGP